MFLYLLFCSFFSWHMAPHSSEESHLLLLQGCYRSTLPKRKKTTPLHCPASFVMFLKNSIVNLHLNVNFFSIFDNKWVWASVLLNPDHRLQSHDNLNLLGKYQGAFCKGGKRCDPEIHIQNHYFLEVFPQSGTWGTCQVLQLT